MSKLITFIAKERTKRKLFLFFLGSSLVIFFPYLFGHFQDDDFIFLSAVEEHVPYHPLVGVWDMDIRSYPGFSSLWWRDTHDLAARLFRPLPSLVATTFFAVFGRHAAFPMHLLSVLLHGVVSFTVFLLFLKLSRRYTVSLLAAVLYLICEDHSVAVGWISASTDLMAVMLMNLALFFHVDFREGHRRSRFLLSNVFLILAFLCKETAAVTPAAIILYEYLFSDGFGTFLRRWRYWIPSLVMGFAYLFMYKLLGFGTHNLFYTDPLSQPGRYLYSMMTGLPIMFAGFLSVFPIGLTMFMPRAILPAVILGLGLFVLFLIALTPFRRDRMVRFCLILFLVALLPQLSVDASERQLYFPYVAGSYLLSVLIVAAVDPSVRQRSSLQNILSRSAGGYFAVSAGVIALLLSVIQPYRFRYILEYPERFVVRSKAITDARRPAHIVYLNTPNTLVALYVKDIYRYYSGRYEDIHLLSNSLGRLWIRQVSDRSFILKTETEGWLMNISGRVLRTKEFFTPGETYANDLFTATILETTADRRDILQMRFDFRAPLANRDTVFLYDDGRRLLCYSFAASPSDTWVRLRDEANPFADRE